MLDKFRIWPCIRKRLESGPFAAHIDFIVVGSLPRKTYHLRARRGHP